MRGEKLVEGAAAVTGAGRVASRGGEGRVLRKLTPPDGGADSILLKLGDAVEGSSGLNIHSIGLPTGRGGRLALKEPVSRLVLGIVPAGTARLRMSTALLWDELGRVRRKIGSVCAAVAVPY